jgi:hypothetical protein
MTAHYTGQFVASPLHRRKIQNRAVDWIAGEYPSAKPAMNFRMVRYDGMLSREFIIALENDRRVLSYWEKPKVFRWTNGLRWKDYTPDYAVDLADGRKIAVEVMPLIQVAKTGFLNRSPFIRRAAIEAGYADFELWTEREFVRQPSHANADLLASERSFVVDDAHVHRMRLVAREMGGRARVGDLRRKSGVGPQSFRTVIRLVAIGDLRIANSFAPLDDDAVVEIPAN